MDTEVRKLIEELSQIRGDNFSYWDDGRSDKECFADELEATGRYRR